MTKCMKFICAAFAMTSAGCDLQYVEPIYNLTSCPIRVTSSLADVPEARGPFQIAPGNAVVNESRAKPVTYAQITVTDGMNIEHRYDKDALAVLRPSGNRLDMWAYTDEGLTFFDNSPEHARLGQIAKQPCNVGQPAPR
jgi:hypothetical protein